MMKINSNLTKQAKSSKPKVKDIQQINRSNTQIKITQLQKQINNLNLNIDYLMLEKQFKQRFSQSLTKQRQKLQNSFFYKNSKGQSGKNHLNNINDHINTLKSQINSRQIINANKIPNKNVLVKQQQKNIQQKPLPCQSLHLLQLFTKEQSVPQSQTKSQLLSQRQQLYKKISNKLSIQQPYLHQKLLQRIKRRAIHQSKLLLEKEIKKLIKDNSSWINKETSKISHQIDQQNVELSFKTNIQTMKRIMNKKVQNNDFIYQNYHNHTQSYQNNKQTHHNDKQTQFGNKQTHHIIKKINHNNKQINHNNKQSYQSHTQSRQYQVLSIKSIKQKYQQIIKKIKSNQLNDNLNNIDKKLNKHKQSELIMFMETSCIKNIFKQEESGQYLNQLKISQKNMLDQCNRIQFQLQKLL